MDKERIEQLVEDTLRPSGPWMAIAPDTWAHACKKLLALIAELEADKDVLYEEIAEMQEELDGLRDGS